MQPKLLDLVSDMLGDTVICRHSHFFAKLAYDEKRVSWCVPSRRLYTCRSRASLPIRCDTSLSIAGAPRPRRLAAG